MSTSAYQNFLQNYEQLQQDAHTYNAWVSKSQEVNGSSSSPVADPFNMELWGNEGYSSILAGMNNYLDAHKTADGKIPLGVAEKYLGAVLQLLMGNRPKCSEASFGKTAAAMRVDADITKLNADAQQLTQSTATGAQGVTDLEDAATSYNLLNLAVQGKFAQVSGSAGNYSVNQSQSISSMTEDTGVTAALNSITGSSSDQPSEFTNQLQQQWETLRGMIDVDGSSASTLIGYEQVDPTNGQNPSIWRFTTNADVGSNYLTSFGEMNAGLSQKGDQNNCLEASQSINSSFQSLSTSTQTLNGAMQQQLSLEQTNDSSWLSFVTHMAQDLFLDISKSAINNATRG